MSQVVIDPRGVDLDVSRYSQGSTSSSVTLGGESYPIGSTVGTSGLFVIGDPHFGAPKGTSSTRTSQNTLNQTGSGNYLVSERYYFEEWNWPVIRFSCLGILLAIMIGLLAAVIALAVQGQAACNLNLDWWQGSVIYHINVPEFYDYDRNDIGDIRGVQERLDYLKHLNVKVVCLNHFLPSMSSRFEEVTSFRDIDQRVGTKDDLQALANALHNADMRLMLEINPMWTSDAHMWFEESRKQSSTGGNIYREFYVWRGSRPNSEEFEWTRDPLRNQFYKQLNNSERPIINWDNSRVAKQMEEEMDVWLNLGVDGFYIRGLGDFYMGNGNLQYGAMHGYLNGWHTKLQAHQTYLGARVLMVEGSYLKKVERDQPSLVGPLLNFIHLIDEPLVLNPVNLTYSLQAQVNDALNDWQTWPSTWVSFHLDAFKGKLDQSLLPPLEAFVLTLPGTPSLHAGQEVGRDPFDTTYVGTRVRLMEWTRPGSGELSKPFEKGSSVDLRNILQLRTVTRLREEQATLQADTNGGQNKGNKQLGFEIIDVDDSVLLLKRYYFKRDTYFYAMNLGPRQVVRDWSAATSIGFFLTETSGEEVDVSLQMSAIELKSKQGILFYVPV